MSTFLIISLILLVIAWYLSFSASRLDRLHHRVETSWEHLDALLQRRSALALEISHASDLDPATKLLLTESAYVSREESIIERNDAERSLSQSLRFLKSAASQGDLHINFALLEELTTLTEKITIAIAIHLEAVNTVIRVRSRLLYRIFHLAGSAKLPHTYTFEDESL
jgi:hypothetical protein